MSRALELKLDAREHDVWCGVVLAKPETANERKHAKAVDILIVMLASAAAAAKCGCGDCFLDPQTLHVFLLATRGVRPRAGFHA